MKERKLGLLGVSGLGFGCRGMSWRYGPADESEALAVLRRYFALGGNFLDTAEIYGPYMNEELIARFLCEVPRDRIILATKFGFREATDLAADDFRSRFGSGGGKCVRWDFRRAGRRLDLTRTISFRQDKQSGC